MTEYYVIKKILNNNVVISETEDNQEIIVMGSGIGFGKHVHDIIEKKKVYKVYELKSNSFKSKFEQFVKEIPFDCFQLTEEIIEYARDALHVEFKDGLILSLADHIHFAKQQVKNNELRTVLSIEEIKLFYKPEYEVALHALEMINERYGINLSSVEASSIAFHLVNAEPNHNEKDIKLILEGTKKILSIIEENLGVQLDKSNTGVSRLVIHLKYFIKRIIIEKEK